MEQINQILT